MIDPQDISHKNYYICLIMAHGLDMEIQFLPGVGPKRAELLRKELAVETVGDLLRLYPFRYIDKSSTVRICDARPDMTYMQIRAKVMRVELYGSGDPVSEGTALKFNTIRRMSVWVSDGTGDMEMVFFKGIKWTRWQSFMLITRT